MKLYIIGAILAVILLVGCQVPPTVETNETANDTSLEPIENVTETPIDTESPEEENETVVSPPANQTTNQTFSDNIPTRYFDEGEVIQVRQDIAYDPEGGEIKYSYSSPLDANGRWETKIGDAGVYLVTITANSGKLESSRQVRLVVESVNSAPTIRNFQNIIVDEGDTIELAPTITDPDGDNLTITYTGFMNSSTRKTTFGDNGEYAVTLTVTDGYYTITESITVSVTKVNRAPVLAAIPTITVTEGDLVEIEPVATDPDEDKVTVSFGLPLNTSGAWKTEKGDAGTYEAEVLATDGELNATRTARIVVEQFNRPPTLQVSSSIKVNETETIVINPVIADPDGDPLVVRYSGFMTTSSYKTDYGDAGKYTVTVTVTDGFHNVSEDVAIEILKVNRPPVFRGDDLFE